MRGSTLALVGPGGTVSTEYTYEPFGRATQTGSDPDTFQYTGRENDETGRYYYRARYYHPGLQGFLSEDPLGNETGEVTFYGLRGQRRHQLRRPAGTRQRTTGGRAGCGRECFPRSG